jgi:NAD(P)-dependent dehydrogenase (short-subunit alcohol dehydrogenase family)
VNENGDCRTRFHFNFQIHPMTTIAISGSRSGIGAATAAALSALGHHLIGIDLRDADVCADLSDPAGRAAAVQAVLLRCDGVLDGLVLCAGLGSHVEPAVKIAEVNYFGAVELLDGLLPALRKGSSPNAVVVSSVASSQLPWERNPLGAAFETGDHAAVQAVCIGAGAKAGHLAYAGSKNALTVAVRRRAVAWGQAGVRLNTVAPGAVDTPLLQAGLQDPRYGAAIEKFVAPIPRRAAPQEIASMIVYLMGPNAGFIHGAQFFVDGGIDAMARPTAF